VAVAGDHEAAGDRAHVDDGPAAPLAHAREHRVAHPDRAEVVRLEERLGPLDRHVLDGATATNPGVVDEDIDAPGAPEHLADAPLDGACVVDVERYRLNRQLLALDGAR